MNYLIRHKSQTNFDENKLVIKLAVQFCKKRNLMDLLYKMIPPNIGINSNAERFILALTRNSRVSNQRYQLSQLWRFFLLENISSDPQYEKLKKWIDTIKYKIEINGWRENQEIINLFQKHNLCNKHD